MSRRKEWWELESWTLGGVSYDTSDNRYKVSLGFRLSKDRERICQAYIEPRTAELMGANLIISAATVKREDAGIKGGKVAEAIDAYLALEEAEKLVEKLKANLGRARSRMSEDENDRYLSTIQSLEKR